MERAPLVSGRPRMVRTRSMEHVARGLRGVSVVVPSGFLEMVVSHKRACTR